MGVITSALAFRFGLAAAVAVSIVGAYLAGSYRGTAHAERACALAAEAAQSQMLGDLLRSQKEAHQEYLAEVERGDAISAELAKTQRRLNETKTEYLAFAHGITGNCPADLGRVLMSWPARDSGGEAGQSPTPSAPADPAATVAASAIAANIAANRWACESNFAAHSALLKWHAEGTLTHE